MDVFWGGGGFWVFFNEIGDYNCYYFTHTHTHKSSILNHTYTIVDYNYYKHTHTRCKDCTYKIIRTCTSDPWKNLYMYYSTIVITTLVCSPLVSLFHARCTFVVVDALFSQFYSNIKNPPPPQFNIWLVEMHRCLLYGLYSWCKDAPLSQHRLKNNKKQTAISTPKQYQPSKPLSCDHFDQRVQSFHGTFKCGRYILVPTEVQQPYNTELFS